MSEKNADYAVEGMWLQNQGRIDDAIDLFRRRIAEFPNESTPHWKLAVALGNQGKFDEGINECRIALGMEPTFSIARLTLAKYLFQLGHTEEALTELKISFNLVPTFVNPLLAMARIYMAKGRIDEAISTLEQVSNGTSNLKHKAMAMLSDIYLECGKYKEAIPLLEMLVEYRPRDRRTLFKLGNAFFASGQVVKARENWERLLTIESAIPERETPFYQRSIKGRKDSPKLWYKSARY